ncbi:MAG TPA: leucyl aminopeptidase, partial [Lachnospiraceae bacterium]|nr:leucyl aminopeptidase [Lachnospiraceae bacterium]
MASERYQLSIDRIREILEEETVKEPFLSCFKKTASFFILLETVSELEEDGSLCKLSIEKLRDLNDRLYEDILPGNYEGSCANPTYMEKLCKQYGCSKKYGQYFSFLYTEIRGLIPEAFEGHRDIMTLYQELFVEIYDLFVFAQADALVTESDGMKQNLPKLEELHQSIYWFESDNCDILVPKRLDEQLDPKCDFAAGLVMNSDLEDLRYLYLFGEYITENECRIAAYLNGMPKEQIDAMASTYTEGYRIGFVKGNKD